MPRELLGELERLVLLALLRLGPDAYAVPIGAEIEARTGHRVSSGTLYVTLRRLEAKGLVTSALGDPTPERGGRAKRYYRIAATGVAALRNSRDAWAAMAQDLDSGLSPE